MFFSIKKDNKIDPLVTPTEPKWPPQGKQDVAKNSDTSENHKWSQEMTKALAFFRKKSVNSKGEQ